MTKQDNPLDIEQDKGIFAKLHPYKKHIGTGLASLFTAGLAGYIIYYSFIKEYPSKSPKKVQQEQISEPVKTEKVRKLGERPKPSDVTRTDSKRSLDEKILERENKNLPSGIKAVILSNGEPYTAHEQTLDGKDTDVVINDLEGDLSQYNGKKFTADNIFVEYEFNGKKYSVKSEKNIPKGAVNVKELGYDADIDRIFQIASVSNWFGGNGGYRRGGHKKINSHINCNVEHSNNVICGDGNITIYPTGQPEQPEQPEQLEQLEPTPTPTPTPEPTPTPTPTPEPKQPEPKQPQGFNFNLMPKLKKGEKVEFQISKQQLDQLSDKAEFGVNLYDPKNPEEILQVLKFEKVKPYDGIVKYKSVESVNNIEQTLEADFFVDKNGDTNPDYIDKGKGWINVENKDDTESKIKVDSELNLINTLPAKDPSALEKRINPDDSNKRGGKRNDLYQQRMKESCEENPDYCRDLKPKEKNDGVYNFNLNDMNALRFGKFGMPNDILVSMLITGIPNDIFAGYVVEEGEPVKKEICGDNIDNNENGLVDEGCPQVICLLELKGEKTFTKYIGGDTYKVKADKDLTNVDVVDNKGNKIEYSHKRRKIKFKMPKDAEFVSVSAQAGDCKGDLKINNDKNSPTLKEIINAAKKTNVFAGYNAGSIKADNKSNSTHNAEEGDKSVFIGGVSVNPDEDIKLTVYAGQEKIKNKIDNKTYDVDDFATNKIDKTRIGAEFEINLGKKLDKQDTMFKDAKADLGVEYVEGKGKLHDNIRDLDFKKDTEQFIGIGGFELPHVISNVTNGIDFGLCSNITYGVEDVKQKLGPATELTRGLYEACGIFTLDDSNPLTPNEIDLYFIYETFKNSTSDDDINGNGFGGLMNFGNEKWSLDLFGKFVSGNLTSNRYGARAGYRPVDWLNLGVEGGSIEHKMKLLDRESQDKEGYFNVGFEINTDDINRGLKYLKSPFDR